MWVLQCIMVLFWLSFENDIHSTFGFYLWCDVTKHLHIKVMCLTFYVRFESILKENSLKIQ